MQHPFEKLEASTRRRALVVMAVVTFLATLGMAFVDTHYKTRATPLGIVSFELAGTPMMAQWMLDAWSEHAGMNAWVAFGIGIDFLYLVLYGTLFSLVAAGITARLAAISPGGATVARYVLWLQLVAPLCDAVENVGLMAMLTRNGTETWAPVSTGFALAKFACLGMCVALSLIAGPVLLRARRKAAA